MDYNHKWYLYNSLMMVTKLKTSQASSTIIYKWSAYIIGIFEKIHWASECEREEVWKFSWSYSSDQYIMKTQESFCKCYG